jgi:FAD/FMN-containing dehydrogenase
MWPVNAVTEGGVMIDLSAMRGVHVDPRLRRARVQAVATWGDYNRETQLHGLASTGGVVSTTGVGGLTLGGGLGWLMGKYGMAVDSLRAVELVTATGDIVRTSAKEHPDLFWALRGGGGNFGVATWLEFELYPVGPTIVGGLVAHPFSAARDVLRFYRDFTASLPDDPDGVRGTAPRARRLGRQARRDHRGARGGRSTRGRRRWRRSSASARRSWT